MIFNNSDGTWIACKVLTHCKSLNPPPPRMRSQTPPLLLKKRENCHEIIKLPLLVHKTFGTIHTIQYYCIKYCSPGRGRGYYNGLYRRALPIAKGYLFQASGTWKGRVFYSWSIWKGHLPFQSVKGPKWNHRHIDDSVFIALKKGCRVLN